MAALVVFTAAAVDKVQVMAEDLLAATARRVLS
jgi:hypothetical protein